MEEKVTKIMDSGDTVDLIFLHFSEAFDSVNHRFLLQKRKACGIDGKKVNWIEPLQHDRIVDVSINESKSQV